MKDIPFEIAKKFCEDYEKDQCVILSWDKKSNNTWVTTYGIGDKNSIQATNAGKLLKDYLKLKRDEEAIPTRFEKWKIETVDRYYQVNGRNSYLYREITYWFEKHTRERKETVREISIYGNEKHNLPDWARGITKTIRTELDDKIY